MYRIQKPIMDIVRNILGNKAIEEYEAFKVWDEIVGKKISNVTKTENIIAGKLYVKVDNPVWRNELTLLKPMILEKYEKKFAKKIISDVIFR